MSPYVYDELGRRVSAPSKGQLREQIILDQAEKQLRDVGPDAMTVESIANAAGITRAALYFYFRSKNDVLAALVQRAVTELTSAVATSDAPSGTTAAAALTSAIGRTEDLWRRHGEVMRAAIELSPNAPVIATLWNDARSSVCESAAAVVRRGGAADPGGPTGVDAVVRVLVAMTEGAYLDATNRGDPLEEVTETVKLVWLHSLALH